MSRAQLSSRRDACGLAAAGQAREGKAAETEELTSLISMLCVDGLTLDFRYLSFVWPGFVKKYIGTGNLSSMIICGSSRKRGQVRVCEACVSMHGGAGPARQGAAGKQGAAKTLRRPDEGRGERGRPL